MYNVNMGERLKKSIGSVIFTSDQINNRIKELAHKIETLYQGEEVTIVAITNGSILFVADLIKQLSLPTRLDCIRISSYGAKTVSTIPSIIHDLRIDIKNHNVLIVDDILDTGKTLQCVVDSIKRLSPKSLRTCVLLDKKERREVKIEADLVGFTSPNKFVIGYGLDYNEYYRNLPYIAEFNQC